MKSIVAFFCCSLIWLTSGCFTRMSRAGNAWNGEQTVPPTAIALDVVTAPVQAPVVAGMAAVSASENHRDKKFQAKAARIISDPDYRNSLVYSPKLSEEDLAIFQVQEVADALSADQVRHLWNHWKSRPTLNPLIISTNTPSDVLTDYYHIIMERAAQREGAPRPSELVYHHELLLHPNLPPEILREIEASGDSDVARILLQRRTRNLRRNQ